MSGQEEGWFNLSLSPRQVRMLLELSKDRSEYRGVVDLGGITALSLKRLGLIDFVEGYGWFLTTAGVMLCGILKWAGYKL